MATTKKRVDTLTITAPSYWASAIINGDSSALSNAEDERCTKFLNDLSADGWTIVDAKEGTERFTNSYHLYDRGAGVSGGDVMDYQAIRLPGPRGGMRKPKKGR